MKVQTKTEEIAVVEKAPLVITTKSNITEVFDLEMVENLPHGSRDNIHNQVVNDVAGGMNGRIRGGSGDGRPSSPRTASRCGGSSPPSSPRRPTR